MAYLYGGNLNGIFDGTSISAFPIGTTSIGDKKPIAVGKAIAAEGTWCKVEFDKVLEGSSNDYWFFVTEQSFGVVQMCIKIEVRDKLKKSSLTEALAKSALFHIVDKEADFIIVDGENGKIDIMRADDNKAFAENLSSQNNFADVVSTLQTFSRGNYMKNLELADPRYSVIFELIPVRYIILADQSVRITDTLTIQDISENGVATFRESELIGTVIRVTNIGKEDAYFSIIDIQPDGQINGILPSPDPDVEQVPEDYKIEAGQSYIAPNSFVAFYAPYGLEVFKLFASREQIDFSPILTQRPRTRSVTYKLEDLFETSINTATRGGAGAKVRSTDMEASTSYIGFEIQP